MNNPYSAPNAVLSEPVSDDETYEPALFSLHGRIGRLRYLAYSFVAMIVMSFFIGIAAAVAIPQFAGKNEPGAGLMLVMFLLYIPIIAVGLIMVKRRLNDLDHSGWFSLLMIVPFLNFIFGLYLMFGSGSPGTNSYGPRPAKNSWLMVIGGLILPIIAIIGILAAVAIPSYQKYVERAKSAAAHQAPQAIQSSAP